MGQGVKDSRAIMGVLPHRYPMLLVDRVLELEPGRRAVGLKNVTANEPHFQGHFPGRPIMPGVLILEAMAQVGAMLFDPTGGAMAGKVPMFGSMDHVRFHRPVVPGDQLVSEITVLKTRGPFSRLQAVGRVDGAVVAEAEYTVVLVDESQLEPKTTEA